VSVKGNKRSYFDDKESDQDIEYVVMCDEVEDRDKKNLKDNQCDLMAVQKNIGK